jgi:hypothetical protein
MQARVFVMLTTCEVGLREGTDVGGGDGVDDGIYSYFLRSRDWDEGLDCWYKEGKI